MRKTLKIVLPLIVIVIAGIVSLPFGTYHLQTGKPILGNDLSHRRCESGRPSLIAPRSSTFI